MGTVGLVELADDTYQAVLTPGPGTVIELNQGWRATFGLEQGL